MGRSTMMLGGLAALGLLGGALSASAAIPSPQAIAAAKTPAQHEALARAYEKEAKSLEELAALHASLARTYGAAGGKPWEYAQAKHCKRVSADLQAAARQEQALAATHEQMARSASR